MADPEGLETGETPIVEEELRSGEGAPPADDPLAALRSAFGDARGLRFGLFVKDGRARHGPAWVCNFDRLPDFEEIKEVAGGGLYEIRVQTSRGHWKGGSGPFQITGASKSLTPREAPEPAPASSTTPPPADGADELLRYRLDSIERDGRETRAALAAALEKLTSRPASEPKGLDPNKMLELVLQREQKSSTAEAIELFEIMERVRRGEPVASGADGAAGDESMGDSVVSLAHKVADILSQRAAGGSNPAGQGAEEADTIEGVPAATFDKMLDGIVWLFRNGRTPHEAAAETRAKVPPVLLVAVEAAGAEEIFGRLEARAGSPFRSDNRSAVEWAAGAWRALFPAPLAPPATPGPAPPGGAAGPGLEELEEEEGAGGEEEEEPPESSPGGQEPANAAPPAPPAAPAKRRQGRKKAPSTRGGQK